MNDVTFYSCEWKIIFHCASNKLLLTAHYSCSCCRTFQVSRIQLNGLSHNISRIKFLNNRETLKIGWNVNQMTLAMMLQSFMHGKFIHFVKVISWKMFWLSKWKRIVNGIGRDLTPGRFRLLPAFQSMRRIAMIYKLRHFIHVFFPSSLSFCIVSAVDGGATAANLFLWRILARFASCEDFPL